MYAYTGSHLFCQSFPPEHAHNIANLAVTRLGPIAATLVCLFRVHLCEETGGDDQSVWPDN